jgi:hypothetical protein
VCENAAAVFHDEPVRGGWVSVREKLVGRLRAKSPIELKLNVPKRFVLPSNRIPSVRAESIVLNRCRRPIAFHSVSVDPSMVQRLSSLARNDPPPSVTPLRSRVPSVTGERMSTDAPGMSR